MDLRIHGITHYSPTGRQTACVKSKQESLKAVTSGGELCPPINLPKGEDDTTTADEMSELGDFVMNETLFIRGRIDALQDVIGGAKLFGMGKKKFMDSVVAARKILGIDFNVGVDYQGSRRGKVPLEDDPFYYHVI